MLVCKKFSEQTKRVENSRKQGVYVELLACLHKSTAFISLLTAVNHV